MVAGLVLRAVEVAGSARWRWLLTDADGRAVADHQVDLDPASSEFEAFCDLYGYVWRNRVPDDVVGSESAIVERVGRWVGERVFGPALGSRLDGTVRVVLPQEARFLLARPLELAHVAGVPLARRGVTLVYQLDGADERPVKQPVVDRLRVLALFSMPVRTSVLALRRERFELARTVRRIAGTSGKAVELRVLQYGVTRERLAEVVEEHPGWDVLHVSGHGKRGVLLLETAGGQPDPVSTEDLVKLLRPARGRLRLAVLSVCESGAEVAAETLRVLDLEQAAQAVQQQEEPGSPGGDQGDAQARVVGLARGLVERLGMAVVGMRYPVVDPFAVALSSELYPRLLGSGQPVDVAVRLAVPRAAGEAPSLGRPALSVGTVAVLGPAAGLTVTPPQGATTLDVYAERMARFPAEPERFVGRTAALVTASGALAPGSGKGGVLFVGMAGAGKTACALELAYQHRTGFKRLAWWQAPTQGEDLGQALASFARACEEQLDIPMLQAVGSRAQLEAFLPHLRALLRDEAVLLVLDNLETLLSQARAWRDPLWGPLVEALTGHGGLSRVVLTSRLTPVGLDPARVVTLPVHALSLAESVLLARELPNLARLLHDHPHPQRDPAQVTAHRELARRVLGVVQGHPKLLELADAAAADPDQLHHRLSAAGAAENDAPVQAFFRTGASDLDAEQFLAVLGAWTATTLADLPQPARALAELLARAEDDDRISPVINAVWSHVWADIHTGDAPALDTAVAPLREAALVETVPIDLDSPGGGVWYRLHPGVAEAVRAGTDPTYATIADTLFASVWTAMVDTAMERENRGGQASALVSRAGLAAAPYLLRLHRWHQAAYLLQEAAGRDRSPLVSRRVLCYIQQVLDADPDPTHQPVHQGIYASVLARVDPPAAQQRLRGNIDSARSHGQYRTAAVSTGQLANLLRQRGELTAALQAVDELMELDRLAGHGPWTQAFNQVQRLQVLAAMGHHRQVLDQATTLLDHLDTLPVDPDPATETSLPYEVQETTLNTALTAALALRDWPRCLDLNRQVQDSKRHRGASAHEQAQTRFNDYGPLLELGRLDEADTVLRGCQQVFEDADDIIMLGHVFSARANLQSRRGHADQAIVLEHTALRYRYQRLEPDALAVSHHNLASYLTQAADDPADVLAHRLAAALLYKASGRASDHTGTVTALASGLRRYPHQPPPATIDELTIRVEAVSGVRFRDVLTRLTPDPRAQQAMLTDTITTARHLPEPDPTTAHLQQWAPVIAAVTAAARGDRQATENLTPLLDEFATSQDWAALAAVLLRIIAGERDRTLLDGLDHIDTPIAAAVLTGLEGGPDTPHESPPPER